MVPVKPKSTELDVDLKAQATHMRAADQFVPSLPTRSYMRSVNSKVAAEQYAKAVNNIAQSIIQQDNPYHDPKQSVTEINLSLNADA